LKASGIDAIESTTAAISLQKNENSSQKLPGKNLKLGRKPGRNQIMPEITQ
jgi:hypothetical protein